MDADELISRYRPQGEAEIRDTGRVRALLRAADDPWLRSLPLHLTGSALVVHPDSCRVLLRWLRAADADGATSEPNLRETLSRVRHLLAH